MECAVCYLERGEGSLVDQCAHFVCKSCWAEYLRVELDAKRKSFLYVPCPRKDCNAPLTHLDWMYNAADETKQHYLTLLDTVPRYLPRTLRNLGYVIDRRGVVRHIETADRFHFISPRHYAVLAEFVSAAVLARLSRAHRLRTLVAPLPRAEERRTARAARDTLALPFAGLPVADAARRAAAELRAQEARAAAGQLTGKSRRGRTANGARDATPAETAAAAARAQREAAPWSQPIAGPLVFEEHDVPSDAKGADSAAPTLRAARTARLLASEDLFDNSKGVVVLVPHRRRAADACWSRRVAIDQGLAIGSLGPYIQQAASRGFATLVVDPHCSTLGRRRTATAAAFEAVREAERRASQDAAAAAGIKRNPDVHVAEEGGATPRTPTRAAAAVGMTMNVARVVAAGRRLRRASASAPSIASSKGVMPPESSTATATSGDGWTVRMSHVATALEAAQAQRDSASLAHDDVNLSRARRDRAIASFVREAVARRQDVAGEGELERRALANYFVSLEPVPTSETLSSERGESASAKATGPRGKRRVPLSPVITSRSRRQSHAGPAARERPLIRRPPPPTAPRVPGSEHPDAHLCYVWDHILTRCPARRIVILAHGDGGPPVATLLRSRTRQFMEKTIATCFLDASVWPDPRDDAAVRTYFQTHCAQFACSSDRPGKPQFTHDRFTATFSAGTTVHSQVPAASLRAVWEFVDQKLSE